MFLFITSAVSTPYENCDNGFLPKETTSLNVFGCTQLPCQVPRGRNITAIVDFRVCEYEKMFFFFILKIL